MVAERETAGPGRPRKRKVENVIDEPSVKKSVRRSKKADDQSVNQSSQSDQSNQSKPARPMSDEDTNDGKMSDDDDLVEIVTRAARPQQPQTNQMVDEQPGSQISLSPLQIHNPIPATSQNNEPVTRPSPPGRSQSIARRSGRASTVLNTQSSESVARTRSRSRPRAPAQTTDQYVDPSLFETVAPQTVSNGQTTTQESSQSSTPSVTPSVDESSTQSSYQPTGKLHTAYLDTRHLIPYQPTVKHSITTPRDVTELSIPMIGLTVVTAVSHLLLGAAHSDNVRDVLYHFAPIPVSVKSLLLPHAQYVLALNVLKQYSLVLPLLLCWFVVMNYVFKRVVQSLHHRQMSVSLKDSDWLSGDVNANFSRWMFGMLQVVFCLIWWSYVPADKAVPDVLDLRVVFAINALFWCQDVLANAIFRENSQSNRQVTFSMCMLWLSMFCTFGDATLLPSLSEFAGAIHSVALTFLLIADVIQSLYAARDFIDAHSDEQLSVLKTVLRVVAIIYGLASTLLIVPSVFSATEHVIRWLPSSQVVTSVKSSITKARGQWKQANVNMGKVQQNVTEKIKAATANVKPTPPVKKVEL